MACEQTKPSGKPANKPVTPIDLIACEGVSIEAMAYLWGSIESEQSIIINGGTASGKYSFLEALCLFIPDNKQASGVVNKGNQLELPQPKTRIINTYRGDDVWEDSVQLVTDSPIDYCINTGMRDPSMIETWSDTADEKSVITLFHAGTAEEMINRLTHEPIHLDAEQVCNFDVVVDMVSDLSDEPKVNEIGELQSNSGDVELQTVFERDAEVTTVTPDADDMNHESFAERCKVLAWLLKNGITEYVDVVTVLQTYIDTPENVIEHINKNPSPDHMTIDGEQTVLLPNNKPFKFDSPVTGFAEEIAWYSPGIDIEIPDSVQSNAETIVNG